MAKMTDMKDKLSQRRQELEKRLAMPGNLQAGGQGKFTRDAAKAIKQGNFAKAAKLLEELNVKVLRSGSEEPGIYQQARSEAGEDVDAVLKVGHYSVSLESGYMVAMDSAITPELAQEGLARELAHRIQNLRKEADFDITDRIVTYYQGPEEVAQVMRKHQEYISQETLSDKLIAGQPADGAQSATQKVEGMEVTLGVRRV
ncbi:MAG: hypothetical protein IIB31_07100 [Chloroflexi bacterium]|nr:hypothetical protein [Chloroflexota bacterium]